MYGNSTSLIFETFLALRICERLFLHTRVTKREWKWRNLSIFNGIHRTSRPSFQTHVGSIVLLTHATKIILDWVWWSWYFLVNRCLHSGVPDKAYIVKLTYQTWCWNVSTRSSSDFSLMIRLLCSMAYYTSCVI